MVPCNVTLWQQMNCFAVTVHAFMVDYVRRNGRV